MRLSELAGKDMIDVQSGTRMGVLGSSDLWIDEETGRIESIILTSGGFPLKRREEKVVPWGAIQKIGPEMILLNAGDEMTSRGTRPAFGTRD
jgi:YlmC/YmxH family sporulation protein